ncbi:DUF2007 domain-containing protein [Belliella kenyensis]|uniref:DUF2007 domain-containing protein n=1 Tax=Belliella kenyensis TaxID=1472724 RepID=A0ABV8ER63_9BACT|nr:DUF2007 domain-containing protein [Belliella kenyensis]MCH7402502.1 DUF2007 domain-containing protein [Belliella kenyensis]MDN3603301.1 DUF2007 domain-containing protein [Belliella kenyensis]
MKNWNKVFEDSSPVRAEIVKGVLESHGIPAYILNKTESAYKIHGYSEVMVPEQDFHEASKIIQNEITF